MREGGTYANMAGICRKYSTGNGRNRDNKSSAFGFESICAELRFFIAAGFERIYFSISSIFSLGTRPTERFTSLPSFKTTSVGIDDTPY